MSAQAVCSNALSLDRLRALLTKLAREAGATGANALARRLLVLIEGATAVALIDGDSRAGDDALVAARALLEASGVRVAPAARSKKASRRRSGRLTLADVDCDAAAARGGLLSP